MDVPEACAPARKADCPLLFFFRVTDQDFESWLATASPLAHSKESFTFISVYPRGASHGFEWNTDGQTEVDDLGFVKAIGERLRVLGVTGRTYGLGFSSGAAMAQKCAVNYAACGFSGIVAGAMQLAMEPRTSGLAPYNYNYPTNGSGTRKVAVLEIHGSADADIRIEGGPLHGGLFVLSRTRDSMALWAKVNGCGKAEVHTVPARGSAGVLTATLAKYACHSAFATRYVEVSCQHHGILESTIDGQSARLYAYEFLAGVEAACATDPALCSSTDEYAGVPAWPAYARSKCSDVPRVNSSEELCSSSCMLEFRNCMTAKDSVICRGEIRLGNVQAFVKAGCTPMCIIGDIAGGSSDKLSLGEGGCSASCLAEFNKCTKSKPVETCLEEVEKGTEPALLEAGCTPNCTMNDDSTEVSSDVRGLSDRSTSDLSSPTPLPTSDRSTSDRSTSDLSSMPCSVSCVAEFANCSEVRGNDTCLDEIQLGNVSAFLEAGCTPSCIMNDLSDDTSGGDRDHGSQSNRSPCSMSCMSEFANCAKVRGTGSCLDDMRTGNSPSLMAAGCATNCTMGSMDEGGGADGGPCSTSCRGEFEKCARSKGNATCLNEVRQGNVSEFVAAGCTTNCTMGSVDKAGGGDGGPCSTSCRGEFEKCASRKGNATCLNEVRQGNLSAFLAAGCTTHCTMSGIDGGGGADGSPCSTSCKEEFEKCTARKDRDICSKEVRQNNVSALLEAGCTPYCNMSAATGGGRDGFQPPSDSKPCSVTCMAEFANCAATRGNDTCLDEMQQGNMPALLDAGCTPSCLIDPDFIDGGNGNTSVITSISTSTSRPSLGGIACSAPCMAELERCAQTKSNEACMAQLREGDDTALSEAGCVPACIMNGSPQQGTCTCRPNVLSDVQFPPGSAIAPSTSTPVPNAMLTTSLFTPDVEADKVITVQGSADIIVSNPAAFCADGRTVVAFNAVLAVQTGVSASRINTRCKVSARNLNDARLLQAEKATMHFNISLEAPASRAPQLVESLKAIQPQALKTQLALELGDTHGELEVSGWSPPETATIVDMPTTTTTTVVWGSPFLSLPSTTPIDAPASLSFKPFSVKEDLGAKGGDICGIGSEDKRQMPHLRICNCGSSDSCALHTGVELLGLATGKHSWDKAGTTKNLELSSHMWQSRRFGVDRYHFSSPEGLGKYTVISDAMGLGRISSGVYASMTGYLGQSGNMYLHAVDFLTSMPSTMFETTEINRIGVCTVPDPADSVEGDEKEDAVKEYVEQEENVLGSSSNRTVAIPVIPSSMPNCSKQHQLTKGLLMLNLFGYTWGRNWANDVASDEHLLLRLRLCFDAADFAVNGVSGGEGIIDTDANVSHLLIEQKDGGVLNFIFPRFHSLGHHLNCSLGQLVRDLPKWECMHASYRHVRVTAETPKEACPALGLVLNVAFDMHDFKQKDQWFLYTVTVNTDRKATAGTLRARFSVCLLAGPLLLMIMRLLPKR